MRKIATAATLAALLLTAAAPAFAADEVFGHSAYYTARAIAEQGYNVASVEEWGTNIKATIVDARGHLSVKIFDPDTLALVG